MGRVGARDLQETCELLRRRAGLAAKPEGMHHGPGFIWSCGGALGFKKESV